MSNSFKLLDCTLRDGGYYTDWDFSDRFVDDYVKSMLDSGMDIIEIGYRSQSNDVYHGSYLYTPDYLIDYIDSRSSDVALAIMINESEFRSSEEFQGFDRMLCTPSMTKVDIVRIATDIEYFGNAYAVFMNSPHWVAPICYTIFLLLFGFIILELMQNFISC